MQIGLPIFEWILGIPIDHDGNTPVINDSHEEESIENKDTTVSTILENIDEYNVYTEVNGMYNEFEECNNDEATDDRNEIKEYL